ncbi:MAG: histidine kinase [Oscillochloridaceae bacterium]|nr:histidine kinase [Chloroflexaceae bacterium]MDW8390219.1 histidine kinase [Oscillochloridaceae bacterium]
MALPYPFAVQSVVTLALLGAPLSALGQSYAAWRLVTLAGLCGVCLIAVTFVPARRLPRWGQVLFLLGQVALTALAQALAPAPLLDYVYLALVLQAIALFPAWLWITFAVGAYAVWSGMLLVATANLIDWLQGNLALAFPATCAIIAALFYLRQQRRSEQVQHMLQQVQQRYDALAAGLREMQQRIMLEERHRLAQTIIDEVQTALARTEQSVAAALAQAQSNLSRVEAAVSQTRAAAASALERLRATVATLRQGAAEPPAGVPSLEHVLPSDEPVIARPLNRVLTWVLPGVFLALTISSAALERPLAPGSFKMLLVWAAVLMLAYVTTQRITHLWLIQVGLAAQSVAILALAQLAHTLTPLLGLLLVLWQVAVRLPVRQIVLHLAALLVGITTLAAYWGPERFDHNALLIGAVTAAAVGGPLLLARRQLERRKQAELRLALLSAEIEQQMAEARMLAVAAERARLAREVHDDLGSRLVMVHLHLQLAEDLAAEDAEAALEQVRESREQLRLAWRSMLAVADAELPVRGKELPQALGELAASAVAPPQVTLMLDSELENLPDALACTVYRAVQEGVTNARKHSRATRIEAQVVIQGGYITVTVTNDDSGDAAPPAFRPGSGERFGLVGLRERAEALNGGMEAGPLPGGGWRLRVVLPTEGV